jgi:SOS response regulatory protein OraA/RecX
VSYKKKTNKKEYNITAEWVLGRAEYLLEDRDYTQRKMEEKLRLAFPDNPEYCESAIKHLLSNDAINDERFADHFIHVRLSRKEGVAKIKQAMYTKGFPRQLIDKVDSDPRVQEKSFFDDALALKTQWVGDAPLSPFEDKRIYNRIARRLASRGFSFDIVNKVMRYSPDE